MIIKINYNGLDYGVRRIIVNDNNMIEVNSSNDKVIPSDNEFILKFRYITDLIDKYNGVSYSKFTKDIGEAVYDKV